MLLYVLTSILLIAKLFPRTPIGAWLNRSCCEAWAATSSKRVWRRIAFLAVAILLFAILFPALPMELALFTSVDVTAFFELMGIGSAMALSIRWPRVLNAPAQRLQNLPLKFLARVLSRIFHRAKPSPRRAPNSQDRSDEEGGGVDAWGQFGLAA